MKWWRINNPRCTNTITSSSLTWFSNSRKLNGSQQEGVINLNDNLIAGYAIIQCKIERRCEWRAWSWKVHCDPSVWGWQQKCCVSHILMLVVLFVEVDTFIESDSHYAYCLPSFCIFSRPFFWSICGETRFFLRNVSRTIQYHGKLPFSVLGWKVNFRTRVNMLWNA